MEESLSNEKIIGMSNECMILERRVGIWSPKKHNQFGFQTKQSIFTILLLSLLDSKTKKPLHQQTFFYLIPKDILFELFQFIATPSIPTSLSKEKIKQNKTQRKRRKLNY